MHQEYTSPISPSHEPLYRDSDFKRELETASPTGNRSNFRRDFARLVHSPAFRRLQGKTQLFPGIESDFFRNRLTHSLEVAQIAKGIALKLNGENEYFHQHNIDTDLVETAALAHDLGHPPFGHNGEYALDKCMRDAGGFEGNAQTLRLVTTLSKKVAVDPSNGRQVGLNLTHRTIGAMLKYDKLIPLASCEREVSDKLVKGYYASDRVLIQELKKSILGNAEFVGNFKTIECSIMDIADDIAYSTYDLEDALKAGFVTPLEVLSYAHKEKFLEKIAAKVFSGIGVQLTTSKVNEIFLTTFGGSIIEEFEDVNTKDSADLIRGIIAVYDGSKRVAADGQWRTELTSQLVGEFIGGVEVEVNNEFPALSSIRVERAIHLKIEVLKHFTYLAMIMSPRLKVVEYRGRDIVTSIFNSLASDDGYLLLPDDCREMYEEMTSDIDKKRLICDFIAGMTDRYAIEFYGRLNSIAKDLSFFKPL